MFKKKPKPEKNQVEDKLATQEQPVVIFQKLTNMQIIIGNVEEIDEYKTEPFPIQKQP